MHKHSVACVLEEKLQKLTSNFSRSPLGMGPGREGRGPRMPDACKLWRSLLDRGPLQKACERALKSDMLPCLPERFAKGEGSSCLCTGQHSIPSGEIQYQIEGSRPRLIANPSTSPLACRTEGST